MAGRPEQRPVRSVRERAAGAVNLTLSALDAFAAEFADHAAHGPCEACASSMELPLPARARTFAARAPRRSVPTRRTSVLTRRGYAPIR